MMQHFISCFPISIILAYSMAVTIVEKGSDWPVRKIRLNLKKCFRKYIGKEAGGLFDCTVCMAFWMALISDSIMLFVSQGKYFFWPFSGFVALAFTWTIVQFMNALDS